MIHSLCACVFFKGISGETGSEGETGSPGNPVLSLTAIVYEI